MNEYFDISVHYINDTDSNKIATGIQYKFFLYSFQMLETLDSGASTSCVTVRKNKVSTRGGVGRSCSTSWAPGNVDQRFSTAGPRPGTRPWDQ
jgi:hypothetical protein